MKNFPMFLKMAGRRVLVLGGGEQAAQKVRLILKTEAEIIVVAHEICAELQSYLKEGRITHIDQDVTVELMQTAILVFSATGCAGAGGAHAAIAKAANTVINVVDMPEICEAITPSIVDRDPLVVAIGTEGCAPILGRQTKSKIETVLEPDLGNLVAFAGRMRAQVAQRVKMENRRNFWNWVFNGSPRQEFKKGNARRAYKIIEQRIADFDQDNPLQGEFVHIHSENGDPEMLRLGDVAKLQEADVIFYQKGIHEDVLEMARRDAERHNYETSLQLLNDVQKVKAGTDFKTKNVAIISTKISVGFST